MVQTSSPSTPLGAKVTARGAAAKALAAKEAAAKQMTGKDSPTKQLHAPKGGQ
jgi:hypothetical protein